MKNFISMNIDLQIVASVAIKRRKPSSHFSWLGKEKENIFILEDQRAMVLYLPSGTTKSFSSKLNSFMKDAIFATDAANGTYLIGVTKDGTIFVWCKDSNNFETIKTPDNLTYYLQNCGKTELKRRNVVIKSNEDASKIIVLLKNCGIHVWTKSCVSGQDPCGTGVWTVVDEFLFPEDKISGLDTVFPSKPDFGDAAFCTFVYNDETRCHVDTVQLKWPLMCSTMNSSPTAKLSRMRFSFATDSPSQVSYVAQYSHVGDPLALAVNRRSCVQSSIMFVSPLSKTVLVTDLQLDHVPNRTISDRRYWVTSLAWSFDDTVLVFVTRLGAFGVVSRAGNLVSISSHGCNVDNGPSRMIFFHPYVFIRNSESIDYVKPQCDDSTMSSTYDILRQKFSVKSHPRMPIFLCSDGYMVTCLKMPTSTCNSMGLVASLISESKLNLSSLRRLLRLRSASRDTWKDVKAESWGMEVTASTLRNRTVEMNQNFDATLWETCHSSCSFEDEPSRCDKDPLAGLQSGTLHFETFASSLKGKPEEDANGQVESLVKRAFEGLLSAWGAMATLSEEWCEEWDLLAKRNVFLLVKLFEIILKYGDTTDDRILSKVAEMMRKCLDVTRFDATWKHLNAVTLSLIEGITRCLIIRGIDITGDLLMDMLRDFEISTRDGQWQQCTIPVQKSFHEDSDHFLQVFSVKGFPDQKTPNSILKRLTKCYKLVYGAAVDKFQYDPEGLKMRLVCRVQNKLEKLGHDWNPRRRKLSKSAVEWIRGNRKCAIFLWEERLYNAIESKKKNGVVRRIAMSILYAHLWECDLLSVVRHVSELKKLSRVDGNYRKVVAGVLRCLGRLMARYFTDLPLEVFPPYVARELPPLTVPMSNGRRMCRLSSEEIKSKLNDYHISSDFNPDAAVELLVSGSAPEEAVWFCHRLGDWKTAFLLAVLCKKSKLCFNLPNLEPEAIMLDKLQYCVGIHSPSSLHLAEESVRANWVTALNDCFLASVLSDFSVTSSLLQRLIFRLKILVQSLEAEVGSDVYLPAPPVYCQQQGISDSYNKGEEESEKRMRISSVVHTIITVMKASNCVVALCGWYISKITKGSNNTGNGVLKELANAVGPFAKYPENCSVFADDGFLTMVWVFEDLVAILWLLHARDTLSRNFRMMAEELECPGKRSGNGGGPTKWCHEGLSWALHVVPFAKCMDWGCDVDHMILTMALESCESPLTAALLARRFPDYTEMPTELETRMRIILQMWRKIVIQSQAAGSVPHAQEKGKGAKEKKLTTLFLYHLNMCEETKRQSEELYSQLRTRTDEEAHFDSVRPLADKLLGESTRAFEGDKDFRKFLGTFFEVALLKDQLEDTRTNASKSQVPLENSFAREHKTRALDQNVTEMSFEAADAVQSAKQDYSLRTLRSGSSFAVSCVAMKTEGLFKRVSKKSWAHSTPVKETSSEKKRKLSRTDPMRHPVKRAFYLPKDLKRTVSPSVSPTLDPTGFNEDAQDTYKLMHWLIEWSKRNHSVLSLGAEPQMKVRVRLVTLGKYLQRTLEVDGERVEDIYGFGKRVLLAKDTVESPMDFGLDERASSRMSIVQQDSDDSLTSVTPLDMSLEDSSLPRDIQDSPNYREDAPKALPVLKTSPEMDQSDAVASQRNSLTYTKEIVDNSADDTLKDIDSPESSTSMSGVISSENPFLPETVQRSYSDTNSRVPYLLRLTAEREDGSLSHSNVQQTRRKMIFNVPTPSSNATIPRLLKIPDRPRKKSVARSKSTVEHLEARTKLIPPEDIINLQRKWLDTRPAEEMRLLRTELEEFEMLEKVSRLRQKRRAREAEMRNKKIGKVTVERASSPITEVKDPVKIPAKIVILPRSLSVPNKPNLVPTYAEMNYKVVTMLREAKSLNLKDDSCKVEIRDVLGNLKKEMDIRKENLGNGEMKSEDADSPDGKLEVEKELGHSLDSLGNLDARGLRYRKGEDRKGFKVGGENRRKVVRGTLSDLEKAEDVNGVGSKNDMMKSKDPGFCVKSVEDLQSNLQLLEINKESRRNTDIESGIEENGFGNDGDGNQEGKLKKSDVEIEFGSQKMEESGSEIISTIINNGVGERRFNKVDDDGFRVDQRESVISREVQRKLEGGLKSDSELGEQDLINKHNVDKPRFPDKKDAGTSPNSNFETVSRKIQCNFTEDSKTNGQYLRSEQSGEMDKGFRNVKKSIFEDEHRRSVAGRKLSVDPKHAVVIEKGFYKRYSGTEMNLDGEMQLDDVMARNWSSRRGPIRKTNHQMDQKMLTRTGGPEKKLLTVKNVFKEIDKVEIQSSQKGPTKNTVSGRFERRKVDALSLMKDIVSSHQEMTARSQSKIRVVKSREDPKIDAEDTVYMLARGLQPVSAAWGCCDSDSDASDTVSPWIVPEEVARILETQNVA